MALLDVKSLSAEIERKDIEEILLGLAKSIRQYADTPIPEQAKIDDFFYSFPVGDRDLNPTKLFVQNRIKPKGRIGIRYSFESKETIEGIVGFSVLDNGENMPQDFFDKIYETLKNYVVEKKLKIIDETLKKEY